MSARLGLMAVAIAVATSGAALAQPAAAPAVCTAPSGPPDASLRPAPPLAKPPPPACAGAAGDASKCKKGEVETFNRTVTGYNAALAARNDQARRYVDALNVWNRAVADYSRCEVERINAEGAAGAAP